MPCQQPISAAEKIKTGLKWQKRDILKIFQCTDFHIQCIISRLASNNHGTALFCTRVVSEFTQQSHSPAGTFFAINSTDFS